VPRITEEQAALPICRDGMKPDETLIPEEEARSWD
jgi:hypothetical protein